VYQPLGGAGDILFHHEDRGAILNASDQIAYPENNKIRLADAAGL